MRIKHILLGLSFVLSATFAQAQVKVGSNPGTISTNAVLDVEGSSGTHTVVLQNGNVGIGTATVNSTTANSGKTLEVNSGVSNVSGLRLSQINTSTPTTSNVTPLAVNSDGDVVVSEASVSAKFSIANYITTPAATSGEVCLDKICVRNIGSAISGGMDLQIRSNTGVSFANAGVGGYQLATSGVNEGNTWTGTLGTTYSAGTYNTATFGNRAFYFGSAAVGEYIFYYITLSDGSFYRVIQNGVPGGTQIQLVIEKVK